MMAGGGTGIGAEHVLQRGSCTDLALHVNLPLDVSCLGREESKVIIKQSYHWATVCIS